MKRLCALLERLLGIALAALVAVTAGVVLLQVTARLLSRYVTSAIPPTPWTEEVAGFLLGWVALLGAAYAYRKRLHVGDDFFVKKMTEGVQRAAGWGNFAVEVLFFAGVLGFGGARLVSITFQLGQATSVLHWPMGAVYLVIPVCGVLMTLFAVDARFGRRGEPGP